VLLFQATANGLGGYACWRLAPAPPKPRAAGGPSALSEIRAGLRELVDTPRLLPVTLLSASIGLFFLGAFLVAMPLLVRDVYGGSSVEIAAINGSMMLGMFTGSLTLLLHGGMTRQGRAMLLSLLGGGIALSAVSFGPPLPVVYGLIFLFGFGGGIATPAGRTLIQDAAPESHRARILSVYSLGFMGSAPIGAFAMGALVDAIGPLDAMRAPGALMLCVVLASVTATDTWRFEVHPRARNDATG
jgi:MFS family permease